MQAYLFAALCLLLDVALECIAKAREHATRDSHS